MGETIADVAMGTIESVALPIAFCGQSRIMCPESPHLAKSYELEQNKIKALRPTHL